MHVLRFEILLNDILVAFEYVSVRKIRQFRHTICLKVARWRIFCSKCQLMSKLVCRFIRLDQILYLFTKCVIYVILTLYLGYFTYKLNVNVGNAILIGSKLRKIILNLCVNPHLLCGNEIAITVLFRDSMKQVLICL